MTRLGEIKKHTIGTGGWNRQEDFQLISLGPYM